MQQGINLISSPKTNYLETFLSVLERAQSATIVAAFASLAGFREIETVLTRLLEKPSGQVRIILGYERQGFNAANIFQSLLDIKNKFGDRFELGVVQENTGIMHAKALLAEGGPHGAEILIGSANLTRNAEIKILNLSGIVIKTITANDNPAGGVRWYIDNDRGEKVGSGVYLYQVTGEGDSFWGKIAVVR